MRLKKTLQNKEIESDINDKYFFLKPKHFSDFFASGFFFRCLYGVIFNLNYMWKHKDELTINKHFSSEKEGSLVKDTLFVGDSTIALPNQEYSFPYLFFNEGKTKSIDILAKPGLNSKRLFEYINPILEKEKKKYDLIFISCFLNEMVHTNIREESFKEDTDNLIRFLQKKLNKKGKIIYVYGDFSLHPIVPDNYFRKYFEYKTNKFISLLKDYEGENFGISPLMKFKPEEKKETIKSYFYRDGLHFSEKGQRRLYDDLMESLRE
jgi:hypothetical protein